MNPRRKARSCRDRSFVVQAAEHRHRAGPTSSPDDHDPSGDHAPAPAAGRLAAGKRARAGWTSLRWPPWPTWFPVFDRPGPEDQRRGDEDGRPARRRRQARGRGSRAGRRVPAGRAGERRSPGQKAFVAVLLAQRLRRQLHRRRLRRPPRRVRRPAVEGGHGRNASGRRRSRAWLSKSSLKVEEQAKKGAQPRRAGAMSQAEGRTAQKAGPPGRVEQSKGSFQKRRWSSARPRTAAAKAAGGLSDDTTAANRVAAGGW